MVSTYYTIVPFTPKTRSFHKSHALTDWLIRTLAEMLPKSWKILLGSHQRPAGCAGPWQCIQCRARHRRGYKLKGTIVFVIYAYLVRNVQWKWIEWWCQCQHISLVLILDSTFVDFWFYVPNKMTVNIKGHFGALWEVISATSCLLEWWW